MNRIKTKGMLQGVTLYRTGAETTVGAQVKLPAGDSVVEISGLTAAYTPASIAVTGQGDFTLISVSTDERIAEPPAALTERENTLTQLQEHSELLKQERAFWDANMQVSADCRTAQQLETAFAFYRAKQAENAEQRLKTAADLAAAKKAYDALAQQAEKQGRLLPRLTALVTVRAEKACDAAFTLTAFTMQGGWEPTYDINAEPQGKTLCLTLRANAWQKTGEDWAQCPVRFSTGAPRGGMRVPQFQTEYVGQEVPPLKMNRAFAARPVATALRLETCDSAATGADFACEQEGAAENTFELSLPVTLESGDAHKLTELKRLSCPCDYRYRVLTPFDSAVLLTAKIAAGSLPLSARARVYCDGAYLGATDLDPADEDIALGRVGDIRAERKTGNAYTSGLFLGGAKAECDFTVTLTSARKDKVEVLVTDRLPVSANKLVSVEARELAGASYDKTTGKLEWLVSLRGGEKKTLAIKYTVTNKKEK